MHESVSEVLEFGREALRKTGGILPYFEVTSDEGKTRPFVLELPDTHRQRRALMFLFGHAVAVGGTEESDGVMIPGMIPQAIVALTDAWYRMPTVEEAASGDYQVAGHPAARECLLVARMTVDLEGDFVVQPYTRHANGIVFDDPIDMSDHADTASSPMLDNFYMGAATGLMELDGEEADRVLARQIVRLAQLSLGAGVKFASMPKD